MRFGGASLLGGWFGFGFFALQGFADTMLCLLI